MIRKFVTSLANRISNIWFIHKLLLYVRLKKIEHLNICYSQEGEDVVLARFFAEKKDGFFVDIGAHHPFRFSNTYKFYQKGWRGINVDAMPGSMRGFKRYRPEDINLEYLVSNDHETVTYFSFNEPALNTISAEEAEKKSKIPGYFIKEKIQLPSMPLTEILQNNLPSATHPIDFLSIDVEGNDMAVLLSNDWSRFRPEFVLVEELNKNFGMIVESSEVYKFLKQQNYELVARTYNTSFYQKSIN